MPDAATLLARAARCYDEPRHGLASAAAIAARGGFAGGAEWMRRALGVIRGAPPNGAARFTRLGVVKYALASGAALLLPAIALALRTPLVAALLLPLAIGAFYAVESRFVFAFPCALDGAAHPLRASHALVVRASPACAATWTVARIAASMVVGGLLGRGFLRSWAIGCLAVLLWYEEARAAAAAALERPAGIAA